MSINWLVVGPGIEGVSFPTYGEYGGPGYTGGEIIEAGETPDFTVKPADSLDEHFRAHDLVYSQTTDPLARAQADENLIDQILGEDDLSGEASLYGGVATLTLLSQILFVHQRAEVLVGRDVEEIADDALDLIREGSIEPDPGEEAGLLAWLAGASEVLGTVDNALVLETADKVLDAVGDLEIEPETTQEVLDLLLETAREEVEEAQDAVDDSDFFDNLEELINGGTAVAQASVANDFLL
jgi:hypothetical protein